MAILTIGAIQIAQKKNDNSDKKNINVIRTKPIRTTNRILHINILHHIYIYISILYIYTIQQYQ